MADSTISGLTAAGALDLTELVEIVQSGANVKTPLSAVVDKADVAFVYLDTDYTLTSNTIAQAMFDPGTLDIALGCYEFEILAAMDSMSSTSGNGIFSLEGTAVTDNILMQSIGAEMSAFNGALSNLNGTGIVGSNTFVTNQHNAAAATNMFTHMFGSFKVSTAGTLIPSFKMTTAAATKVKAGSYFRLKRLGGSGVYSRGSWS